MQTSGFRNSTRDAQILRYQRAGNRAVSLEGRGFWLEAAEAWRQAAHTAPREEWQRFSRERAERCLLRYRGKW
ncbi:hypothetical protein JZM25_18840 [Escherichia coli]|uniref:hypothetical protein n=1 Tax=Escherichia coli TaxID=562 RepID=UPI0019CFBD87|nr:hypothetical protein [Escherichia coli]MBN6397359.1 hypothetical protein [Escherichia coli]